MFKTMLKKVVIGLAILGAGYLAYTLLTKKKTRVIKDRDFEIEVEVENEQ